METILYWVYVIEEYSLLLFYFVDYCSKFWPVGRSCTVFVHLSSDLFVCCSEDRRTDGGRIAESEPQLASQAEFPMSSPGLKFRDIFTGLVILLIVYLIEASISVQRLTLLIGWTGQARSFHSTLLGYRFSGGATLHATKSALFMWGT